MIKKILKTTAITAILSVFLSGCLPMANEVVKGKNDHTDVDNPITGPLNTKDNVWPGKDENNNSITYYINSIYNINNSGDLVIEEGAIVKFGPKGGITVNTGGSLEASGVVFTSSKDKRGREILAAGSANPFPGDWKQIYIYGGYASFYGCEFSYGGNSLSTLVVKDDRARCRIDNCLFRNNGGDKEVSYNVNAALKYYDNVDYNEENSITNCTFENNVWPLSIPAYFSLDGSNHFNTTDKPNEYNFIHINSYKIDINAVWATQDVPYIHPGTTNKISISNGASLTIKGGTEEKPTVVEFDKNGLTIYNSNKSQSVEIRQDKDSLFKVKNGSKSVVEMNARGELLLNGSKYTDLSKDLSDVNDDVTELEKKVNKVIEVLKAQNLWQEES